jgi:hypothetical protein
MRSILASAVLAASVLSAPELAFANSIAAGFLPHRAVYEMSLEPSRSGRNRLESVRGRLVYEFMGSQCEGWTTNLRLITELRPSEGQGQTTDIRSNSVEAGDSSELRFITRSGVNGRDRDQADGTARRTATGVSVVLRRPAQRQADLPDNEALFPVAHMARVIETARAGAPILQADIYDGSEGGEKIYATTAVIGRLTTAPLPDRDPANIDRLRSVPRVSVALSYFEKQTGGEALPLYEMHIELFEVGITRSMLLDYGEFAIRGTLSSLELLPEQACAR